MSETKQSYNETLLRQIIDEMPDVFILKDENGDFVMCNKTVAKLYDTTPEKMVGKNDGHFGVPEDMVAFFKKNAQEIMASGKTEIVYEDTVDAVSGETRHFKSIKKPIKDNLGKDQVMILAQDITDLIQNQSKTQENENRLNTVMEIIGEGLWDWHIPSGDVIHNDRWYSILDLPTVEKYSVENFKDYVHPDDLGKIFQRVDDLLSGKKNIYESEHRMLKSDGTVIYVRDRGMIAERDADGNPLRLMGSFKDITSERLAQAEIMEAKLKAEEANEAKTVFLSNISHEFRTPLNGILGFAQMLKHNRDGNLTEKQIQWIDQVLRSGNVLLDLVNEVLDLAVIEQGQTEYTSENTDVGTLIKECIDVIMPKANDKRISLHMSLETNKNVRTDRRKLYQVLLNLLDNAVKYNREKGSIIVTLNEVSDNKAEIKIEDTGVGISPKELEKVFDPFYRVAEHAGYIEGTGIGLSIVKKTIEMLKGEIVVNSSQNQGTCFTIRLPFILS